MIDLYTLQRSFSNCTLAESFNTLLGIALAISSFQDVVAVILGQELVYYPSIDRAERLLWRKCAISQLGVVVDPFN